MKTVFEVKNGFGSRCEHLGNGLVRLTMPHHGDEAVFEGSFEALLCMLGHATTNLQVMALEPEWSCNDCGASLPAMNSGHQCPAVKIVDGLPVVKTSPAEVAKMYPPKDEVHDASPNGDSPRFAGTPFLFDAIPNLPVQPNIRVLMIDDSDSITLRAVGRPRSITVQRDGFATASDGRESIPIEATIGQAMAFLLGAPAGGSIVRGLEQYHAYGKCRDCGLAACVCQVETRPRKRT